MTYATFLKWLEQVEARETPQARTARETARPAAPAVRPLPTAGADQTPTAIILAALYERPRRRAA
jgi:hypothetical protein